MNELRREISASCSLASSERNRKRNSAITGRVLLWRESHPDSPCGHISASFISSYFSRCRSRNCRESLLTQTNQTGTMTTRSVKSPPSRRGHESGVLDTHSLVSRSSLNDTVLDERARSSCPLIPMVSHQLSGCQRRGCRRPCIHATTIT